MNSETRLEVLSHQFFLELAQQLPGQLALTVAYREDRLIGFTWELVDGPVYHFLFMGVDYSQSIETDLYFNLVYRGDGSRLPIRRASHSRGPDSGWIQEPARLLRQPPLYLWPGRGANLFLDSAAGFRSVVSASTGSGTPRRVQGRGTGEWPEATVRQRPTRIGTPHCAKNEVNLLTQGELQRFDLRKRYEKGRGRPNERQIRCLRPRRAAVEVSQRKSLQVYWHEEDNFIFAQGGHRASPGLHPPRTSQWAAGRPDYARSGRQVPSRL